jgi:tetratricopeptide (TPR) repeat protein
MNDEEWELSVAFAQAEMALAESLGQRGESLHQLTKSLQMLGKLKEAEQHMRAFLRRGDLSNLDRAFCLIGLAGVLRDQGRLSEALERAEQATALTKTIADGGLTDQTIGAKAQGPSVLDRFHMMEASILERMGRLHEAIAKDDLTTTPDSLGGMLRVALLAVAEGRLEDASDALRNFFSIPRIENRRNIEGPHVMLRAKKLLCQVLHRLGGAEAEEAALRAELRHEEARRGDAFGE